MALSSGLLHTTASTFHSQRTPHSVRLPSARRGGFSVKAMSPVVLVEKTESEKVDRIPLTSRESYPYSKVTYSFLDRLINLGLPRTRDFQGVNSNSFDGNGYYSLGFREQSVFPEIGYDVLGKPRGMDVCISTTAETDKEAYRLLALMGMPFREGSGPATEVRKKKLKSHHFDSKAKSKQRTKK